MSYMICSVKEKLKNLIEEEGFTLMETINNVEKSEGFKGLFGKTT